MLPFHLLAFAPFGVLAATAGIGAGLSIWIRRTTPTPAEHPAVRPSAVILRFPAPAQRRAGRAAAKNSGVRAPIGSTVR